MHETILALVATLQRHEFRVGSEHLIVGLISGLVTVLCVFIHYESMSLVSFYAWRLGVVRRMRVLFIILAMLVAHVIEVWVFGLMYWILEAFPRLGEIKGAFEEGALDLVYFSVVTFTTMGYGDMTPSGALRILSGTEALVGLSLITWSASLAFLEMQRDWLEYCPRGAGYDAKPGAGESDE